MDAIFAFCVLYFISDTSLFYRICTNQQSQQILFYSEVSFFLNHFSWNSLYLYYTGSSCTHFVFEIPLCYSLVIFMEKLLYLPADNFPPCIPFMKPMFHCFAVFILRTPTLCIDHIFCENLVNT